MGLNASSTKTPTIIRSRVNFLTRREMMLDILLDLD